MGNTHPFESVQQVVIDDTKGTIGRSAARNVGMSYHADWYFFLDADDMMEPDALSRNDFLSPATFGAIRLDGFDRVYFNYWPCGWKEIVKYGATGTLSMGFFCRADVARSLRFNEDMNAGEDFDFYLRLPSFTKIKEPLVRIGYNIKSAHGPRGYDDLDWTKVCNDIIRKAIERDPEKFSVGSDALLEKAGRS